MSALYNFCKISDMLACCGQPREGQLPSIAAEGYQVVINLGLTDTKYALADEARSVEGLAMAYHHIPVLFDNPQIDDLRSFIEKMNEHINEKMLVHCAANYRASVFTGLFLLATDKLDEDEMTTFIEGVWQPDAIWQQFLEDGIDFVKNSYKPR